MGACVCPSYGNPEAYTNCPLHGSRRETVDEVEARAERYRKALEDIAPLFEEERRVSRMIFVNPEYDRGYDDCITDLAEIIDEIARRALEERE